MPKRKPKPSRWASDAAMQAIVRFGPELSGLKELARQAQEQRDTTIAQAHGSAAAMMGAIDQARPEVAQIYDAAGLAQARAAQSVAATDLSGLGPGANAFRAAAGIETGEAARHVAEARAANLSDLSNRRVQTRAGEQFAVQGAQQTFAQDLAKVLARRQDLGREQGAFEASTIGSLEEAARGRQLSARNSARTAATARRGQDLLHADRQASIAARREAAAASKLPGGGKLATPQQHGTFKDHVEQLRDWIRHNHPDYGSRHELATDLLQGVPGSTVVDPKTGEKHKDPGVPKAPSQLALSVALDLEFDKHISARNVAELHRRRFSVRQLDYPGAAAARAAERRRRRQHPYAPLAAAAAAAARSIGAAQVKP